MLKIFRKPKFKKFLCFLLVVIFSVNIAGCGSDNGVPQNKVNPSVGMGSNTIGYNVYAESTFDPMTKDIFMGYLLSGREMTLVVVPGEGDGSDDSPYTIKTSNGEITNMLFNTAQAGIYKYNEAIDQYENPEKKLLLYYVTDLELQSWFNSFAADDNFLSNVMDFASSDADVEKPSRFKCEQLVNMGTGLNATEFCGSYNSLSGKYHNGIITNSTGLFNDVEKGGMILLFGYGSIEGYITYQDIVEYEGSKTANGLQNARSNPKTYKPDQIRAFNYKEILYSNGELTAIGQAVKDKGFTLNQIESFANGGENEALKEETISLYTEAKINAVDPGYEKLKVTYELLGNAILSDNINVGDTINEIKVYANNNKSNSDKWSAIYEMVDTMDSQEDFYKAAEKEAFDIKMSVALYSRYTEVIDYPNVDNLTTQYSYNTNIGKSGSSVGYGKALELANGIDNGGPTNNSYLLLITADGFVLDRGTEDDQEILGASDMSGLDTLLAELVRMDGCPNGTIALEVYNMLVNLKIYVGVAYTIAGVSAMAVAGIGLAVASVISKIAAVSSVTPVPGGRIAALVLIGIAGLIALAGGLITLFSGLKDKARIKGLGASEENYCDTYVATFNVLFESLALTIPVYHYEIPKDTSADANLSITACQGTAEYNTETGLCSDGTSPVKIPLYYYANKEQSEAFNLEGCPMLMYFNNGILEDYIYGASTSAFVVEMLRLWGLLAMREIVYDAKIEDDNTISVYHTTNTNARTHTIYSSLQCFTLDYAKDLSSLKTTDFCYDVNGNHITNYESNATKFNGYSGIKYISEGVASGRYYKLPVTGVIPTNSSAINEVIMNKYNTYFSATNLFKFNKFKEDQGVIASSDSVHLKINAISKKIATYDSAEITEPYVLYKKEDGAEKVYYFVTANTVYKANSSVILNFDTSETQTFWAKKVATYSGDLSGFEIETNDGTGSKYTTIDFLEYLDGKLAFTDSDSLNIPIYFTVTVKETPQATYRMDGGTKKECDAGEYLYYRPDTFMGFDGTYECHSDDSVKAKDIPYSANDPTLGVAEEDKYNYYSSSVQVGYVRLTLTESGSVETEIVWFSKNA